MLYADYEEEEQTTTNYKPPVAKRRATVGHDYIAPPPRSTPVSRTKSHSPVFTSFGIGMYIVVLVVLVWNMVVVPWWHGLELQWHYGDNQVSVMGADVGHGGTSRFICFDSDNDIVVVEVVAKKYNVYIIPTGKLQYQLVTLSLRDVNGDGKVDLVLQVDGQEGVFVLFNTGDAFSLTK
jgi:hypothetical protein